MRTMRADKTLILRCTQEVVTFYVFDKIWEPRQPRQVQTGTAIDCETKKSKEKKTGSQVAKCILISRPKAICHILRDMTENCVTL